MRNRRPSTARFRTNPIESTVTRWNPIEPILLVSSISKSGWKVYLHIHESYQTYSVDEFFKGCLNMTHILLSVSR